MQVVNGQDYTFHFSVIGGWVSTGFGVEPLGTHFASDLDDAGFPVTWKTAGTSQSINVHGDGTVDLAFTYNGTDADSNSLGNAMQDAINAVESIHVNFESANGGNVTTGGANEVTKALPSPSTIGVAAVALFLVAIAIYSFAGHAGEGLAMRV
jgi:hypothetical protein